MCIEINAVSYLDQWFSNLSWGPPATTYFVSLSYMTHPVQVLPILLMSWWIESGVLNEGDIQNMLWLGVPRTGLRTTDLDNIFPLNLITFTLSDCMAFLNSAESLYAINYVWMSFLCQHKASLVFFQACLTVGGLKDRRSHTCFGGVIRALNVWRSAEIDSPIPLPCSCLSLSFSFIFSLFCCCIYSSAFVSLQLWFSFIDMMFFSVYELVWGSIAGVRLEV